MKQNNGISQDEAILYYVEELKFLSDKCKSKIYNKSAGKFKDFNEFKQFVLQDIRDILEGIEYHKTEDFGNE